MSTRVRRLAAALFCLGLSTLLVVSSCSNKHIVSIAVTPQNASVTQIGQTTQFTAMGLTNHSRVAPEDITSTATWTSSTPSVATIASTGLATAAGCGTTTITAKDSGVTGTTQFTVTCSGTGGGTLQSITVLPSNPTVPQIGQTTQFLALGTLVGGGQEDLTGTAMWSSSNPAVADFMTADPRGLATTHTCGTSTISAEFQPTGGTPIVGTTLLTVSCNSITSIELLIEKNGSLVGTVTSTPTGIDCGTVCGGLFNEGTGFRLVALSTTGSPGTWGTGCDQVIPPKTGACYFTLVPDSPGGTQKVITVTF